MQRQARGFYFQEWERKAPRCTRKLAQGRNPTRRNRVRVKVNTPPAPTAFLSAALLHRFLQFPHLAVANRGQLCPRRPLDKAISGLALGIVLWRTVRMTERPVFKRVGASTYACTVCSNFKATCDLLSRGQQNLRRQSSFGLRQCFSVTTCWTMSS